MNLLKEPLLHFLFIGAALFGLYAAVNPASMSDDKQIVVDEGRINNLTAIFKRTWQRDPTPQELKSLIDNFVVEEILYRQALAMGMDKNDPVIRRRMRQKMEFIATDASAMLQPSDAELNQYLQAHNEKFATDPVYSFEQIYVNTDRNPQALDDRIAALQQQLVDTHDAVGDQTLLSREYTQVSAFEVNRQFGNDFAAQLDKLPLNAWSPPVRSGLGVHFVRITDRQPGTLPALAQIHPMVEREWMNDKQQEIRQNMLNSLMAEYQITVEWPKPGGNS